MKKIISLILCLVMVIFVVALAGCANKENTAYKFGMGVYSNIEKAVSATNEKDGSVEANTTAAVILVDAKGKIVDCKIDTMQAKMGYTLDGKAVEAKGELKTKYELKEDYGMKLYAKAEKEWYEQIDAFIALVKGKTLEEVKALMAEDGKGNKDVVNAGCTIYITDYVKALEKAFANLLDSAATKDSKVSVGFASTRVQKDAVGDTIGSDDVDTHVVGMVKGADNKVIMAATDAVQVKTAFSSKGELGTKAGQVKTKKEMGDNYGMKQLAKAEKEWYEQAAAFDAKLAGKTADDIAKLVDDKGYGVDEIQSAGCTIEISDMIKAAVKAAK